MCPCLSLSLSLFLGNDRTERCKMKIDRVRPQPADRVVGLHERKVRLLSSCRCSLLYPAAGKGRRVVFSSLISSTLPYVERIEIKNPTNKCDKSKIYRQGMDRKEAEFSARPQVCCPHMHLLLIQILCDIGDTPASIPSPLPLSVDLNAECTRIVGTDFSKLAGYSTE